MYTLSKPTQPHTHSHMAQCMRYFRVLSVFESLRSGGRAVDSQGWDERTLRSSTWLFGAVQFPTGDAQSLPGVVHTPRLPSH